MSAAEIAEFIGDHGSAVLTTLRGDGGPVPLPVWYVALDGVLYIQTPRGARRVRNIDLNPRVAVLIDDGEQWTQLRGVLVQGRAERVTEEDLATRVLDAFGTLFTDRRPAAPALPSAASVHYADMVVLRIVAAEPPVSWDNRKLRKRP